MYRFLLTPRWWGINLFLVLAIPFCVFMGSWQLGRFEDRVESHEAAEKRSHEAGKGPARPLTELLPVDKETSGERATATGRWDRQLLVPGRELDGKQGYYVLGLLRTDGGKALPVVRGWLPGEAGKAKAEAPKLPSGEVTVTGALQASENSGTDGVHKAGGLPEGQLGMISAASLVNLVPYEVYDAWVTVDRSSDGMTAVPPSAPQGSGLDLKAFQNLGYTGEWFIFAGFVVFMWFRLFRREVEFAKDAELGLVPREDEAGSANGASGAASAGDEAEPATATEAGAETQAEAEAEAGTASGEKAKAQS
ncbi:SURF1 family protein [Streptomyces cavernicola]|uniref:SURF1-like protein n=1 Tax=Streptomyces cavernicola TaxID=3043613 RepID=A0ABT6SHW8_9ACTN|nr:SURF1 family protein [Streptomyces sp. B-S-A6]MDI3407796.1 SURF1 family protein [Streptomyces sp. B-S-A6]